MLVTASAADRHTQKRLAGGAHDVIEVIIPGQWPISRFIVPNTQSVIAGGSDAGCIPIRQLIARQLLHEKAVIGLVFVEGVDDIIAVFPHEILAAITLISIGLSIAHQIQPVPPPFLAVLRPSQQVIDHLLKSIGRLVRLKGLYHL